MYQLKSIIPSLFCFQIILANGDDLPTMQFNQGELRKHLADCFCTKLLQPFPHTTAPATCVPALRHDIMIYCDCELPEVLENMVECDGCDQWYHLHCVGVKSYMYSN